MVGTQGLRMFISIYIFIYIYMYIYTYIYGTQGIHDAQHAYGEQVECKLN